MQPQYTQNPAPQQQQTPGMQQAHYVQQIVPTQYPGQQPTPAYSMHPQALPPQRVNTPGVSTLPNAIVNPMGHSHMQAHAPHVMSQMAPSQPSPGLMYPNHVSGAQTSSAPASAMSAHQSSVGIPSTNYPTLGSSSAMPVNMTASMPPLTGHAPFSAAARKTAGGSAAAHDASSKQLVTRRALQELVQQIHPDEQLSPEVEEVLLDIADDFIESVTSFACSLAKHRKSDTLEAKDLLLHLERNWFMRVPGFGGDELRSFRRQTPSELHKQRLAAVRRSLATDAAANQAAMPSTSQVAATATNGNGNNANANGGEPGPSKVQRTS